MVAVNLVEASGERSNLDERFAIHMKEYALARHDDGGPLLIPTGVALTGGACSAEGEIIGG